MGFVQILNYVGIATIMAGMIGALNADYIANNLEGAVYFIVKDIVTRNTNVGQHVKNAASGNKKKLTYHLLKYILQIGFTLYLASKILASKEDGFQGIATIPLLFYPWVTWSCTLKDILLNDDILIWSIPDKRKYILFPVNLVDNKVLGKPIYGDQQITQIEVAKRKMTSTTVFGELALLFAYANFMKAHILLSWAAFFVHDSLNAHLNAVADYISLTEASNKYDHLFGSYKAVFTGGEADDKLGMHYEMFARTFKPTAAFFKKRVFKKMRSEKFSVKESLAATYMARGVCLVAGLYVLGVRSFTQLTFPLVYYGLQTTIPLMGLEDKYMSANGFFRYCWFLAELAASGVLLYKPLVDAFVAGFSTPSAVTILSLLISLEVYNKGSLYNYTNQQVEKVHNVLKEQKIRLPNLFRTGRIGLEMKFTKFKKYAILTILLLSLRNSYGKFIYRNKKIFIALPEFLNSFLSHIFGWWPIYLQELFSRYHPTTSLRNYESNPIYFKDALKIKGEEEGVRVVTLANKDSISLTGETRISKIRDELIQVYSNEELTLEKSYDEAILMQVFDSLPCIDSIDIIGKQYDGFVVPCNPNLALNWIFPTNKILAEKTMGWGKIFFSKHKCEPVVVNYNKKYYGSFPGAGLTSIHDIQFRDKTSAAMAYQTVPVIDYFRCLSLGDENRPLILMGVYMLREKLGGFFIMKEDKNSVFL